MAVAYRIGADGKVTAAPADLDKFNSDVVWLDVPNPEQSDLATLERIMGFEIPNKQDMSEIELSNRLYRENNALIMTATLIPKSENRSMPLHPATFILSDNLILTIRFNDFYSFERVATEVAKNHEPHTAMSIFLLLVEEMVSDRADSLEFSMRRLEELTSRLFSLHQKEAKSAKLETPKLDDALKEIGGMGEMVANIRESITSLQRMLNYVRAHLPDNRLGDMAGTITSLCNDMTALSDEASFFMNKLSFNLDATLGMINVEETKVIRLLSVVTLLLSPPMLIAGIYGMNFDVMPETKWAWGYPYSLLLMAATAVGGIWYLRVKKWM